MSTMISILRLWPLIMSISTCVMKHPVYYGTTMIRLNSGTFWSFDLSKWKSNRTCSDCRASKIIANDTKPEPISLELNIENRIFNFCVGVWVGGHEATNFLHISKDAQENSTYFDTDVVTGSDREKWFWMKNLSKIRSSCKPDQGNRLGK